MKFIKLTCNRGSHPVYVNVDNICVIQNDYESMYGGSYCAKIIVNNGMVFAYQSVEEVMQLINEGENK